MHWALQGAFPDNLIEWRSPGLVEGVPERAKRTPSKWLIKDGHEACHAKQVAQDSKQRQCSTMEPRGKMYPTAGTRQKGRQVRRGEEANIGPDEKAGAGNE